MIDISIPVPMCRKCRQPLIVSNVESGGEVKEWIHDRDPKIWSVDDVRDNRRFCVPYRALLRLPSRQRARAETYVAELLPNDFVAQGIILEDNPIATWAARSWA
jgi:hypothetical protein